jgi:hypothetical protein
MEGFMTDSRNIIIVKKGEKNNFVIKKINTPHLKMFSIYQGIQVMIS